MNVLATQTVLRARHLAQPRADRRKHARWPYHRRQNVAFGALKTIPASDAFINVEFVDLSESGCSFRMDSIPTSKDVVIELGVSPKVMYVQATIRHMTPKIDDGKFTCLVGCEFTDRLT